ncbi:hypothetical protein [Limnoglobus roseus]|uniref:hypothetical protein n=1 Tax=Limnoglobus roseus TaxID=2598579 RepID=UPI001C49A384|nr:hypothetical protein [Limnoglobus roseus]
MDENQAEVVAAFRKMGCSVQPLHTVGQGCPDLLIGHLGVNRVVEVKDGKKPLGKRQLTPDQQTWHNQWRGEVDVAESVDDAVRLVRKWTGWQSDS